MVYKISNLLVQESHEQNFLATPMKFFDTFLHTYMCNSDVRQPLGSSLRVENGSVELKILGSLDAFSTFKSQNIRCSYFDNIAR